MSRRRDLEQHRHSLTEIREIMNSMKTLAYMESRKLGRYLNAQNTVVSSIEQAAADFLSFHAQTLREPARTISVFLIAGSERGFCGDFNRLLVQHLDISTQQPGTSTPLLVTIGNKLHNQLEHDPRVAAHIDGATVVEEIPQVLNQLVDTLYKLQQEQGILTVHAIYHKGDSELTTQKLLPPFLHLLDHTTQHHHPPVLQLTPSGFMLELTEHYLFAALHAILYTSLMAENQLRVSHLDGAVRHMDQVANTLQQRCNALRQEEIIEEIEVILLSAGNLAQQWQNRNK